MQKLISTASIKEKTCISYCIWHTYTHTHAHTEINPRKIYRRNKKDTGIINKID